MALDAAAISGTGTDNQPTGILAASGIGSVAGGTNGLAPTLTHLLALGGVAVANANADQGSTGFLINTKTEAKLRGTPRVASTDSEMLLNDGQTTLIGRRMHVSNNVPSNLVKGTSGAVCSAIIFGNFADLVIGQWGGGIDLLVDPYTLSTSGQLRLVAQGFFDILVRRAASFRRDERRPHGITSNTGPPSITGGGLFTTMAGISITLGGNFGKLDELKGKAHKTAGSIKESFKGMGKALAFTGIAVSAGAAFSAIAAGAKAAVAAASDLGETISKTRAVFKSSAAEMLKWAEGASRSIRTIEKPGTRRGRRLRDCLHRYGHRRGQCRGHVAPIDGTCVRSGELQQHQR